MTQAEFADLLGVTRRTLVRYEQGHLAIPERRMVAARRIAAEVNETPPAYGGGTDYELLRMVSEVLDNWIGRGLAAPKARAEMQVTIMKLASGDYNHESESESGSGITQNGTGNVQQVGKGNIIKH